MFDGGMFLSKAFTAEEDDSKRYQFAVCWGKLIKDTETAMYNKKKTSFCIKWHNKSFQNVTCWGDSTVADIASGLEKGDMVAVFGTMVISKYVLRKGEHAGEERESRDIIPNIIVPLALVSDLMGSMHHIDLLSQNVEKILANVGVDYSDTDEMESSADEFEGGDDDFMQIPDDEVDSLFM